MFTNSPQLIKLGWAAGKRELGVVQKEQPVLTVQEMREELQPLQEIYNRTLGKAAIEAYYNILKNAFRDRMELRAAAQSIAHSARYFPKPVELLEARPKPERSSRLDPLNEWERLREEEFNRVAEKRATRYDICERELFDAVRPRFERLGLRIPASAYPVGDCHRCRQLPPIVR